MAIEELAIGACYYFIGSSRPEPVRRYYVGPVSWLENTHIFLDDRNYSYTVRTYELSQFFATESAAWSAMADETLKAAETFAALCLERAQNSYETTSPQPTV